MPFEALRSGSNCRFPRSSRFPRSIPIPLKISVRAEIRWLMFSSPSPVHLTVARKGPTRQLAPLPTSSLIRPSRPTLCDGRQRPNALTIQRRLRQSIFRDIGVNSLAADEAFMVRLSPLSLSNMRTLTTLRQQNKRSPENLEEHRYSPRNQTV